MRLGNVVVKFPGRRVSEESASGGRVEGGANGPGEVSDATLLLEIACESTAALTRFYYKYAGIVMAFAMSHLAREQDCREIVNDVFLTVWSRAGEYAGRSSVRTWLLGITHHKTIDYLRKHQRNKRLAEEYGREPVSEYDSLEETMASRDDISIIKQSLQQLSAAHREVIHLAFYEDMSCSEIVEVLQIPSGTVKTRLMHARQKLKQIIANNGMAEELL